MKTQTLYYQEGRSNKIYTASISDTNVVQFAWGPRGGTMQTKTVGPLDASAAEKLYQSKLNEKMKGGYLPGEAATPLETAGYTPAPTSGPGLSLVPELVPKPMLLNEITDSELLALAPNPDWYFQEKHDGDRILLVKQGSTLTSYSRSGRKTSALPKPIVTAALACPDFILDGELVGDTVWAFDLLAAFGEDLKASPYSHRLQTLHTFFESWPHGGIRVVETATDPTAKLKLFEDVHARGGEGIALKKASAAYAANRPATGGPALKYKFWATASVIVSGHNVQSSFNMKLFDGTDLGRCTIPVNRTAPPVNSIVEIRYLNCTRGGSLYQPVFLRIREDIEPTDCTIAQLEFRGEAR